MLPPTLPTQETLDNVWRYFWLSHVERGYYWQLVGRGQRMLLSIPQCTAQPPKQINVQHHHVTTPEGEEPRCNLRSGASLLVQSREFY